MGDRPVLTEDAPKVTLGKEDSTRTVSANKGQLLAEMGLVAVHRYSIRGIAEACFTRCAIHAAPAGTKFASLKFAVSLSDPTGKLALGLKFCVRGLPGSGSSLDIDSARTGAKKADSSRQGGILNKLSTRYFHTKHWVIGQR
jgi:hypothetical protein